MFQVKTYIPILKLRSSWRTKLRVSLLLFLICELVGTFGCSTGLEKSPNYQTSATPRNFPAGKWTEHHKQLVQQGRFTDAAMLASLYDSSSWQVQQKDIVASSDRIVHSEDHSEGKKKKVDTESLHKVKFQTEYSQKTSLDGKWHTQLGWTLMVNGNYAGAAAAYREALRQNATLAQAYLGLGITLRNEGQIEDAIEAYQKALDIQPRYAAALVHLGYIYADGHQGQPDYVKAQHLFNQASRQGDPFAMIALLDLKTRERD